MSDDKDRGVMNKSDSGIINAVSSSSLGRGDAHLRDDDEGTGEVGSTHQSHGFSSPDQSSEKPGGAAAETGSHYWTGSTAQLTIISQGTKVLSWMDHRANHSRVTPDDENSAAESNFSSSSPAHPVTLVSSSQNVTTSNCHGSHHTLLTPSTNTGGGGMDILAEIICHAPPMILPTELSQDSTSFNVTSHPQQNSEILFYQETNHQVVLPSSQQSQHSHVHQPQYHQFAQHEISSPNNEQRVSIIPSYQEIYREMGIPHQFSNQRHHAEYSTMSYSVEEIGIDACHLSQTSDHRQHCHVNDVTSHDDPTDVVMSQSHSRTPTIHFGHVNRDHIEEGKELYTRKDLYQFGVHVSDSKDVHGNMKDGCDSIVIRNLVSNCRNPKKLTESHSFPLSLSFGFLFFKHQEKDLRECDGLLWFFFSADRTNGGGALCQSYHKNRPIRVFRSSLLGGKYAPPFLDVEDDVEEDSDVAYRYDGLYMVRAVWDIQGQETELHPVSGENGWQTYFFTRLPKKPLEKKKWEGGMEYNAMGCQELWSTIQKMRGVRKPKKFEIPTPPVKLGQMKKCAISGQLKERKCVGYVKPVVEMPAASHGVLPQSKRKGSEEKLRHTLHQQDEKDSSEARSNGAICGDDSISNSSEKVLQQHSPSQSNQAPSKVLTPRPRLNSIPDPKKSSPIVHDDVADSSDSESLTSELHPNSKNMQPESTQSNSNNIEPSNYTDDSLFFPKRASAARAEAANRDMFGGSRSYKRKSAAAVAYPRSRSGGGRKRNKIRHLDDSSSSEDDQFPDVVDSSILTVGSRVLVFYKGALFKATIRKRREKASAHDFLIHYDGNKKSNVHWIGSDRINKILEINVDTPPKKKNSAAFHRSKRINGEIKRKSLENQESYETIPSDSVRDEDMSGDEEEREGSHSNSENDEMSIVESNSHDELSENRMLSSDTVNKERFVDDDPDLTTIADNCELNCSQPEMNVCNPKEETAEEDQPDSLVLESEASNDVEEIESELDSIHVSCTVKTSISPKAPSQKHRHTTVADVCFAKGPSGPSRNTPDISNQVLSLADTESDTEVSGKGSNDNPTISIETNLKQEFAVGGHVYVEYRHILYSSTILKKRKKRSMYEYLVHYEGYKKSSNTWVKESALHEVNADTIQRFEEQRLIQADSPNQSDQLSDSKTVSRRETASDSEPPPSDSVNISVTQKKIPLRRTRSDASNVTLDMLDSGVAFLAGSMVFVEWTGALYLAKMLKKRYSGNHMEYLISYDGYKSNHDAWVSVQKIYEVNPQTKRVFKKISSDLTGSADGKQKSVAPPGPKLRETRRKTEEEETLTSGNGKKSASLSRFQSQSTRVSSSIDTQMQGIETGVEFLPGSTLFAVYKDGLCLAKMLKRRGKGEYTEYLVQYNGLKKAEEAWVSTRSVYEINPQTKRMFRKLSVTK